VVCDPMAGGGSMMYTAHRTKHLVLIELEDYFVHLLYDNRRSFGGSIEIAHTDCRPRLSSWPETFDLICFSPPYSNQIKQNKGMPQYEAGSGTVNSIVNYTQHKDNLSNMGDYQFDRAGGV